MKNSINRIAEAFPAAGNIQNIIPFGSGHINDTFKISSDTGEFILQRVNHTIFKDIEGLTNNIIRITKHISGKINSESSLMKTPDFFKTKEGKYIYQDENGNYWRLMNFIKGSKSYDLVEDKEIAYKGGKAYGWFIKVLSDFPVETLTETIPDFHNINFRLNNFKTAVEKNPAGRVSLVRDEIKFVYDRADEMKVILRLGEKGEIPKRVTHNDTKINNVLFDNDNNAISVIDLDTVMPGYVHYDFGDAIRTFTNTACEDEKDLSKVSINMAYYKAFTKGFLSETRPALSVTEIKNLPFSAKLMTFIIGLRFLTDYLEGDIYYKTSYPGHNLTRTRVQFKLLESIEEHFTEMESIL